MSFASRIRSQLRSWFSAVLHRTRLEDEMNQELLFHMESYTAELIRKGVPAEEAGRRARSEFGGIANHKEAMRASLGLRLGDDLSADLRYAVRGFRRNPVFTFTVIATLALGIGATTAVFSVVDRILFRPLPYAHFDRLVSVGLVAPIEPQEFMLGGSYYEWRDKQTPFEALTSEIGVNACDLTEEKPARLNCGSVEATFLPTLGLTPVLGRNFTADEDRPHAPRVALISYQLWQSRFGGDPGILNKLVRLDGQPARLIGVLPKDFEMPRLQAADLLLPQALDEGAQRKADPGQPMWAFARLKPGTNPEQAKAALQPLFDYSLRLAPPQFRKEVHLQVRSLRDRQVHDVRLVAWVLLGLVLAVLSIACANVTSLLMARGAGRERELAVRSALGASRARLMMQALTESLVLSLAGAAAGCVLSELLLRLFIAVAPEGIPFLGKAQIDLRIILFTFLVSLACGALFGLMPALQNPRAPALAGRSSLTASHAALRQSLVVAQIAMSMILLAGGALLYRSFWNLQNQHLGMRAKSVIAATLSLGQYAYPAPERRMAFFQQLERELKYGPGVSALAISDSLPPGGHHRDQIYASITVDGRPKPTGGTGGLVAWRSVTPDYFRALDIPIVQGEGFTEDEANSRGHFVVISRLLAGRMFPGEDAIGHRLQLAVGATDKPWYTVVGIAANVKNGGLAGEDEPEYYRLRRNVPEDWDRASIVLIKTTLPADAMESWMRSRVAALDPTLPVNIETLSERVHRMADQPRFETLLVGFFASTGLLLAVIGLYGVISFLVAQRTQEIGVRIALGASRTSVLRLILWQGGRLIALGLVLGVAAALAVSQVFQSLLFSIGPHDPLTFIGVTLVLALVAFAATLIPARAAMKVEPVVALRYE